MEVALTAPELTEVKGHPGAHFAKLPGRRPCLAGLPGVALASALATVFSWRTAPWRVVAAGIDSWQAGLALAFEHHLQWGPQMVFTFGPYGFVEDIMPVFRGTAAIGFLYALAVTWGLAALTVGALRPSWGLLPAGIAGWATLAIAANTLEAPELASATALGLALASLRAGSRRPETAWWRRWGR